VNLENSLILEESLTALQDLVRLLVIYEMRYLPVDVGPGIAWHGAIMPPRA